MVLLLIRDQEGMIQPPRGQSVEVRLLFTGRLRLFLHLQPQFNESANGLRPFGSSGCFAAQRSNRFAEFPREWDGGYWVLSPSRAAHQLA